MGDRLSRENVIRPNMGKMRICAKEAAVTYMLPHCNSILIPPKMVVHKEEAFKSQNLQLCRDSMHSKGMPGGVLL